MSYVSMKVGLVTGAELSFNPDLDRYALDPNRDTQMAIDKLDQGYNALRMWLVMQLPPQDQAKYSQVQQPQSQCRCPKGGGYPAPETRSQALPKVPKGPAPGSSPLPTVRPGHIAR